MYSHIFYYSGETSAGKSSLLNLLLGTDVLPHSLLCATATICRLHNSKDKRIEIESHEGVIKTISLDESDQTSEALHKRLKPYISSKEMRIKNPYKNVDIYWPLPLLQVGFYSVRKTGVYRGILNFLILKFFIQNIDCGYSLELPWRGGSNMYPLSMFLAETIFTTKEKSVYYMGVFS